MAKDAGAVVVGAAVIGDFFPMTSIPPCELAVFLDTLYDLHEDTAAIMDAWMEVVCLKHTSRC